VQQTLLQWRECDSFIYCRINLAAALIAAAAAVPFAICAHVEAIESPR
jgi:hypothetical protein